LNITNNDFVIVRFGTKDKKFSFVQDYMGMEKTILVAELENYSLETGKVPDYFDKCVPNIEEDILITLLRRYNNQTY